MKIAIPILFFSKPGGYRVLSNLASKWVEMGHTVTFLCTAHSDAPYFPTTADVLWLDDNGYKSDSNINDGICDKGGMKFVARNLLVLLRGISRYAKDYDIILANQNLTAWPVMLSWTSAKKVYYIQAYEPEYYELREDKRSILLKYISRFSYLLPLFRIVNSPIYYKYKWLRCNRHVPPGVDFSVFYRKVITEFDRPNEPIILGCIGRKEIEKGTLYVFKAFEYLLQVGVNVELHVAFGNLPSEQSSHPKCKIIVPQNDKELGEYYRSLDIMIAPGLVQLGAPHYPVLESMACGVPVITTGYLPATNENAWIVPVKDHKAIALAVINILDNKEVVKSKTNKAYNSILRFGWAVVSEEMIDNFKSIKP